MKRGHSVRVHIHLLCCAFMFVLCSYLNKMAAANHVLEIMLGMSSSGIGHYDDLMDRIVWIDEGTLAKSDADEESFKHEEEVISPLEGNDLPTLLTKRWNNHVLPGSPEKKARRDVVIGRDAIVPLDARAWYREVFPFHVQHRLRKLARWRWNRLRDAVAFDDDFCLWCLFESNNRE